MKGAANYYVGDFGTYEIPMEILAAAGVTTDRSLWDMRFASARRFLAWGRWMDQCEISEART